MKQCSKCKQLKDFDMFYKDNRSLSGLCCSCKVCFKAAQALSNSKHRQTKSEYQRQYRLANREIVQAKTKEYRLFTKAKHNTYEAKRRALKLSATRDDSSIALAYEACDFLNMITGEWHEVDHIIPLVNKNVCGLHTSCNLQILTRSENRAKGNRFTP